MCASACDVVRLGVVSNLFIVLILLEMSLASELAGVEDQTPFAHVNTYTR